MPAVIWMLHLHPDLPGLAGGQASQSLPECAHQTSIVELDRA
jgi:hypothetical protein